MNPTPILPVADEGRRHYCAECGGTCSSRHHAPAPARKLALKIVPGHGLRLMYASGGAVPLKKHNGQLISGRGKIGGECSQAVSDWKTKGQPKGSQTALTLARCRAMARAQGGAKLHRAAGNDARAEQLEQEARGEAPAQAPRLAATPANSPTVGREQAHIASRKAALGTSRPPLKIGTPVAVRGLGTRKYRVVGASKDRKTVHVRPDELTEAQKKAQRGRYGAFDRFVAAEDVYHPEHAHALQTLSLAEAALKKGQSDRAAHLLGLAPAGAAPPRVVSPGARRPPKAPAADRAAILNNRLAGAANHRHAQGDIAGRDARLARRAKIQGTYPAVSSPAKPFALNARGPAPSMFANGGAGATTPMFDEMRGASARDLPGQSNFLEGAAPQRPDYRRAPQGAGAPAAEVHPIRQDRLSTLAARAQRTHERLRDRGVTGNPYTSALDRAIGLKRTAQREEDRRSAPVALKDQAASARIARGLSGETRGKTASRLQKLRGRLREEPAGHTNHAPGTITPLHTDLIHFDPERFQYKLAHNSQTGSVGSLEGVKAWNPELAGIMQVWKDPANGKVFVINGHNRLDRAKRLTVPKVNVQFIDARNAHEAKAKGALTNIAEGHGTPIDAANFMKSTGIGPGHLEEHGITLKGKLAREGASLSKLDDPLFRRVIAGTLPEDKAALIGGAGLNPAQQHAVVKQLDKAPKQRPISTGTLRELLDNARVAGTAKTQTFDLFGPSEEETSLALHRSRVQEAIKDRLSREKKLFGTVAKARNAADLARAGNQLNTEESGRISHEAAGVLDVFDRLKNRSGPVASALNRAAERIHAGEQPKKVIDESYQHILHETNALLGSREAAFA